jgi:hypothetical protein
VTAASEPARRLLELLEQARPIPLVRTQVRVKRPEACELVAAIREAATDEERALLDAAVAVEEALDTANPVPLTDDVRITEEDALGLVRALRAAGA